MNADVAIDFLYRHGQPLDANLDRVVAEKLDDGSWDLGWDWSAIDADAWQAAEREWKGHHIVHKLAMLRAWGRIASGR